MPIVPRLRIQADALRKLAVDFEISDAADLRNALARASSKFKEGKAMLRRGETLKPELAQIEEISKLASMLHKRLEQLSEKGQRLLWAPDAEVAWKLANSEISQTEFGHLVRWLTSDGERVPIWLDRYRISEAIGILRTYADLVLFRRPTGDPGRPPNIPLLFWVMDINTYWIGHLNRKATFDEEKGTLLTKFGRFCFAARQLVEPKASETQMASAIRYFNAQMRKHFGKKGRC